MNYRRFLFPAIYRFFFQTRIHEFAYGKSKTGEERREESDLSRVRAIGRPRQCGQQASRVERRGRAVRDLAGPAQTASTTLPARSLSIANPGPNNGATVLPAIAAPFIRSKVEKSRPRPTRSFFLKWSLFLLFLLFLSALSLFFSPSPFLSLSLFLSLKS